MKLLEFQHSLQAPMSLAYMNLYVKSLLSNVGLQSWE